MSRSDEKKDYQDQRGEVLWGDEELDPNEQLGFWCDICDQWKDWSLKDLEDKNFERNICQVCAERVWREELKEKKE